jgi:prepilin-type N-terminal cleavage/methylation domain-containing protein/prepilin-type processing-associated H-X9-DG protein
MRAPRFHRATALGARTSSAATPSAFTLVELLVVIGIIALLISILLPVLGKARESANTVKCAANLRSVGQGLATYVAEFRQTYPAAYMYVGQAVRKGDGGVDDDSRGYVHWSSYLFKGKIGANDDPALYQSTTGWEMFQCPSIDRGGLPPTNTIADNLEGEQKNDAGSVIDQQAPRCAYTVNEAICPRNKFYIGFQGAVRYYQFVRAGNIRRAAETVLATELPQNWKVVSAEGRVDPGTTVCKSHRPVHGFTGVSGGLDMEKIAPNAFGSAPKIRRCAPTDLAPEGAIQGGDTRLNWVGRNHGKKGSAGRDDRKSNFLYADGHVETKQVADTLLPFQWGDIFYSLVPGEDIQN